MGKARIQIEQLALIYEQSPDFVFLMKREGLDYRYRYINEAAKNQLLLVKEGILLSEGTEAHMTKGIMESYNRALHERNQHTFQDYTFHTKEVRKYETTVIPIFQEDGDYIFASTKEIAFDRNLQDKFLFMRSIFFNTFLSTLLLSGKGELLEANPRFVREFDLDMDELRSQTLLQMPFLEATTVKIVEEALQEVATGENLDTKLLTFVDQAHKQHHFTAAFSPLMQEQEVVAVLIVLQEITDYIEQSDQLRETSHNFQSMKRAISAGADISFADTKGRIIEVNSRFCRTTGYERDELIGQTHRLFNSAYHPPIFFEKLWATIQSGNVWRGEIRNRRKDGDYYWIDATIIPLEDEDGVVKSFFTVNYNITEKVKAADELRNNARVFQLITQHTNDLIVILDQAGQIRYASPSYSQMLQLPMDRLLTMHYTELLAEKSVHTWSNHFAEHQENHTHVKLELQLRGMNGKDVWTEANYTVIHDHVTNEQEVIMLSREITARKEKESQLAYLAYHDSLTQIPNRRYLQDEFVTYVQHAERYGEKFALLYIDGDNFKDVNDCHGHDVGDKFLYHFAQTLVQHVRASDLVVRLGGDEFLIVARELDSDMAMRNYQIDQLIAQIKAGLRRGWQINDCHFAPTTSIGVAYYPEHGQQLKPLLDSADNALYAAKQLKDGYHIAHFPKKESI